MALVAAPAAEIDTTKKKETKIIHPETAPAPTLKKYQGKTFKTKTLSPSVRRAIEEKRIRETELSPLSGQKAAPPEITAAAASAKPVEVTRAADDIIATDTTAASAKKKIEAPISDLAAEAAKAQSPAQSLVTEDQVNEFAKVKK